MKFFTVLTSSMLIMNTLTMAGGDIESNVMVPEIYEPSNTGDSGFYLGGAYSRVDSGINTIVYVNNYLDITPNMNLTHDAIMLQAGYKLNSYVAVEARYWNSIGNGSLDSNTPNANHIPTVSAAGNFDFDAWGIYLKPMYPILESVNVYALLGYGDPALKGDDLSSQEIDGFQWGLGGEYQYTENVSLFLDFVRMYDDKTAMLVNSFETDRDLILDTFNFGVTYKF